jgi:hypothetical protein
MDLHLVQNAYLNVCKFICNDACKLASKFYDIIYPTGEFHASKYTLLLKKSDLF